MSTKELKQKQKSDSFFRPPVIASERKPTTTIPPPQHFYKRHNRYFTEFTITKGVFYSVAVIYVVSVAMVVVLESFFSDEFLRCDASQIPAFHTELSKLEYANVLYRYLPCRHVRLPRLLFLTRTECNFGRRLVASTLLGSIIGWERRDADRPAGIRTMSLVSLGSCLFSINSGFGFLDSPMSWDASRVSAAIPSGVGFLGAGLIFKEADKDEQTGTTTHVVHGLTTAASLWISSAIGVACAGELYFAASFTVALILVLLRFGPRQLDFEEEEDEEIAMLPSAAGNYSTMNEYRRNESKASMTMSHVEFAPPTVEDEETSMDTEKQQLLPRRMTTSVRRRAGLSGIL